MKKVLLCTILFCVIALPALGELTDADLNEIRLIVKEEIKSINADLDTLKTDGAAVKTEVTNLKETVNRDFDTIQKNFDRQNNIIIACIGIPMAILAIGATVWSILAYKRNRKADTQQEQIKSLEEQIGIIGEKLNTVQINTESSAVG